MANEGARRRSKSGGRKGIVVAAVTLLGLGGLSSAFALPTGGTVVSGSGDILSYEDGQKMAINQHSEKLITNWTDFSVKADQNVTFNQPSASSIALNRVIGTNASNIQGQINANGQVFLVNPNGVVFGQGAQVNVGALVASTKNISDADFTANKYQFSGNSPAEIVNSGTITAAQGGNVALLGSKVRNDGVIQAQMGRVALGAGNDFTLNFDGNNLLNLQVSGTAVDALAQNGGLLKADGGQVYMTAKSAGTMLQAVVNNQGSIEANTLRGKAGKIVLDGGDMGTVLVGGALTASALDGFGNGGVVETKGARTQVHLGTRVNTQASSGQTGTWKIASAEVKVSPTADQGSNTAYADTLSRNLATTNIELASTSGDVATAGAVTWNSGNRLTLSSAGDINLNGALMSTGANARVELNAAKAIKLNDKVTLKGAGGSLGLNYGTDYSLGLAASVMLSGERASFDSNGSSYKVIQNVAQLQDINANLNGLYVLGSSLNGYGNIKAIGGDNQFKGVFDGLGNTISGYSVSNTGANVGLFSSSSGSISNLKLANMTINGGSSNDNISSVGGLVGTNLGKISNVSATGLRVNAGSRKSNNVGGLVGFNDGGSIDRATVTGTVSGNSLTSSIGGLVGENATGASGIASVTNSMAKVDVSGSMQRNASGGVGGLIGTNKSGYIGDSSSQGLVGSSCYGGLNMGGLVGYNQSSIIERSNASGSVRGYSGSNIGGLVGFNANSSITQSRASGLVTGSGSAAAGGLVGLNQGSLLTDVKASGNVSDTSSANVGGLIGNNVYGRVDTGEALGNVTGGANSRVGGLVGNQYGGTVEHAVARGKVVGGTNSHVGGLIGYNDGSLRSVEASGDVSASHDSVVGGLVGTNGNNLLGSVETASATGNVRGESRSVVGGLVGQNNAQITNSSAIGTVSAGSYATMGGLVGVNKGKVRHSLAGGKINFASPNYYQTYGGLVGVNYGNMSYNSVSGNAALVPVAGANHGVIQQW